MTEKIHGAVLIVATNRDDRRLLFEALDTQEFDAIYTAKDIGQARTFLAQEPHIDLVLLEFLGKGADALSFCAELQSYRPSSLVPVIGILAAEPSIQLGPDCSLPVGVVDWISSPVDPVEALRRINAQLSESVVGDASVPLQQGTMEHPYVFECSLDELAVVDAKSGRILDVNPSFVARSGFTRIQVLGSRIETLDAILAADLRSAVNLKLSREGATSFRAQKPRADGGSYAVDVDVQTSHRDGEAIHLYAFRELGELGRYAEALEVISNLSLAGGGEEGINAVIHSLIDWLRLDFAALISLRLEQGSEMQPLLVFHRLSPSEEMSDPMRMASLKKTLDGEEVVILADACRNHAEDEFVVEQGYECLICLPLCDERKVVLGALVVARSEPFSHPSPMIEGLRAVAHRLALELELRRAREQGRVRGLQDALTGLPNRLLFNDRLESVIQEAHRTGEMFAVLFVDLDRFKNI
ncbi:MAG: diguanylate cyclase, partial [Dokdonella sp.]